MNPEVNIEIEKKVLLQTSDNADILRKMLIDIGYKKTKSEDQLNHYFLCEDIFPLKKIQERIFKNPSDLVTLYSIIDEISSDYNAALRTRTINGTVLLIMKLAPLGSDAIHGHERIEWEAAVDISLSELDEALFTLGYSYISKWSRERSIYTSIDKPVEIAVDKNAGYGYIAEFECMIKRGENTLEANAYIDDLLIELGLKEIDANQLARMYDFYTQHWQDYYGTDKVFSIA